MAKPIIVKAMITRTIIRIADPPVGASTTGAPKST